MQGSKQATVSPWENSSSSLTPFLLLFTPPVSGALLALLTWWLDNDPPYTAEQMAQMFERLTGPAVAAALG